jgi:DNA polymerase elongation subunit (family B)
MRFKPTQYRRNVVLDIETVSLDPADPNGALSGLTGRIVCISLMIDNGSDINCHNLINKDESEILRIFWSLTKPGDVFVGFNIMGFDLPFIRQRSWIKQVLPSRKIDLRRFYSTDVLDCMQMFSNWGSTKYPSLESLGSVLGFGGKAGDASQVAEWWAKEDFKAIADYCAQDVLLSYNIFWKLMFHLPPNRVFLSIAA